jgi:cellulose biosynthesis protein BcsQ
VSADRPVGRIVTFYSYKGGTGRSMALANFAWILAASGKRVLAIDWDLEAPGLHRYFRPFLTDPDLFETDGLIDTFWSFAAAALARTPTDAGPQKSNGDDFAGALDDAKRRLNWNFVTGGYIDFVGAGRQGATYSERVNTFDWKRFYELGGANMLDSEKVYLRSCYDWVLIDSRTGVSDTSGISTMQLPDTVVVCFTLNRQSIDGVDAVMRSIQAFRSPTVDGSKIKFFPLATRIENAERERLENARTYARAKLAAFVPQTDAELGPQSGPLRDRGYWDDMEVAYRPWYAFEEVITAFGDASGATRAADTMQAQMEAMARCITGDKTLYMPEILPVDRASVLARYALTEAVSSSGPSSRKIGTGARAQPVEPSTHSIVDPSTPTIADPSADTDFLRGLLAKEQLWRNDRFSSGYLLSNRELDLLTDEDRQLFGRNMLYYVMNSERGRHYARWLRGIFAFNSAIMIGCIVVGLMYAFANWPTLDPSSYKSSYELRSEKVTFAIYFAAGLSTVCCAAWITLTGAGAVFAFLVGEPPYGMTILKSFRLLLNGQALGSTGDYDPDDDSSFTRPRSTSK